MKTNDSNQMQQTKVPKKKSILGFKFKTAKSSYFFSVFLAILCYIAVQLAQADVDNLAYEVHLSSSYIPNFNTETGMIDGITYYYTEQYDALEIATLDENAVNKTIEKNLKPLVTTVEKTFAIYLIVILVVVFLVIKFLPKQFMYTSTYPLLLAVLLAIINFGGILPCRTHLLTDVPYDYSLSPLVTDVTEESFYVDMEMFRTLQLSQVPEFAFIDIKGVTDGFENNYYKFDSIDEETYVVKYIKSSNQEMVGNDEQPTEQQDGSDVNEQ